MSPRTLALALVLGFLGCASPPPYQCSSPIDSSGRGLALCHESNDTPVCDAPGDTARYEANAMGMTVLVGGTTAVCDTDDQVVCPDRTVVPHCIFDPVSP